MAGAYRCPVCGIDFPSGTPGAPKSVDGEGADKDRGKPWEREGKRSAAAKLREALHSGEATVSEEPPVAADADDAVFEYTEDSNDAPGSSGGGAALNVRPADGASKTGKAVGPSLSVRPDRGERTVIVSAEAAARDIPRVKPRRRRSKAASLMMTLLAALVLLGGVTVGVYAVRKDGDINVPGVSVAPLAQIVVAADGWVNLPAADHARVVRADGAFRLRLDGEVYTLTGEQAVRIPSEASASLRVVRAPAVAKVERVGE
ncbi:MAG: hypothetical protein AAGB11_08650 [Pseudomonadota bacterium]